VTSQSVRPVTFLSVIYMTGSHERCLGKSQARLLSVDLLYAISGFCVSLLVGMTGVGGGSLMTPLLMLFFGIHPATAVGTDLLYAAATKSAGTLVHGLNLASCEVRRSARTITEAACTGCRAASLIAGSASWSRFGAMNLIALWPGLMKKPKRKGVKP
jgi:Sulfite exporter TauE/SafE